MSSTKIQKRDLDSTLVDELNDIGSYMDDFTAHVSDKNNPHHVTPEKIGAGRVNPNLLDNWYFANPVNQRGRTEYFTSGYTIDRWKGGLGETPTVILQNDSIRILNGSTNVNSICMGQTLESLKKGTYTFSALVKECTGRWFVSIGTSTQSDKDFKINDTDLSEVTLVSVTFDILKDVQNYSISFFRNSTGVSEYLDVLAAKLELGTQQTLAHQDANGNWVLNEIPNYAEQMAICKQYDPVTGKYIGLNYLLLDSSASIHRAVKFQDKVGGADIEYLIYGEHNITAGSTDLTSGTSPLTTGCIYQKYE